MDQPEAASPTGQVRLAIADDATIEDRFSQFRETMGDAELALADETFLDDLTYQGSLQDPDTGLPYTFTVAWSETGVTVTDAASQEVVLSYTGTSGSVTATLGGSTVAYDAEDSLSDVDSASAGFFADASAQPRAAQLGMRALVRSMWLMGLDQAAYDAVIQAPDAPFSDPGPQPQVLPVLALVAIGAGLGIVASLLVIQVTVNSANYQSAVNSCENMKVENQTAFQNEVSNQPAYRCSRAADGSLLVQPVTVTVKDGALCKVSYSIITFIYSRGFISGLFGYEGEVKCGPLARCFPDKRPDTIVTNDSKAALAFCNNWAQAPVANAQNVPGAPLPP